MIHVTLTQNWTFQNYQQYIINNNLDNIWYDWCNPKSINGIRVASYTPVYSNASVLLNEKKCKKISCNGTYRIPEDSTIRKILYKKVCDECNATKTILYRWISSHDNTKIYFNSPDTIRNYGFVGRAFYATLTLYNKNIISSNGMYVDDGLMIAHTLGMDIDIVSGTICDSNNKEDLNKCLNIIRENLDTFIPNSYNLQTSGNGLYVFIHHLLCTSNIRHTMSQFNSYIKYLQKLCRDKGIKKVKIDPINMASRVYKMIGSIHQKYDLVCIPLDFDCNINDIDNNKFKLENFNIDNYIDEDNQFKFYNRYDTNEKIQLYKFLEEHCLEKEGSNLRAIKHQFTDAIASDTITGENQSEQLKLEYTKKINEMTDEEFINYYVGWKNLKTEIPGRVIFKNNVNGRKQVEMIGVKNTDDINNILDEIWNTNQK